MWIKSTKEISDITKISTTTIVKYLKQGNVMWCQYDAEEELIKNGKKNGKLSGKEVEIFL